MARKKGNRLEGFNSGKDGVADCLVSGSSIQLRTEDKLIERNPWGFQAFRKYPPHETSAAVGDKEESVVVKAQPAGSVPQQDVNAAVAPVSLNPTTTSVPTSLISGVSQPISSRPRALTASMPNLVTPGQFAQSASVSKNATQSLPNIPAKSQPKEQKDVEVVLVSSSLLIDAAASPVAFASQPPLLPLPVLARSVPKPDRNSNQQHFENRGRGSARVMGRGSSRPVMNFKEEFDFIAMNERFYKDEI
ncbi:hypothetical protein QQ045_018808 [Rhodiola kirilowii]